MSASKVKLVNRVLADLLIFLKGEPASKYLEELDEDALPQMSDAVLTMVQFETALEAFHSKYHKYFGEYGRHYWLTKELQEAWSERDDEDEDEDEDE
ncbi:hypothetical protein EN745_09670 [Mesorhizobium sp. M4A.F.Ca.ET.022.05.2.1]|nr:hypothetical protein EN745_09670 [Mesorhizobium sp. M4A.F.Ca.ET.022.05.2.1]RWA73820.1 MAG: hypothetical protein EOQ29_04610 [Mesorhizobium sp.]TIW68869.1 MAG: hypothetical protein E5V60_03165 [Mesorhizobium sp.]